MIDQREIVQTIAHLQTTFEDLVVRGLRSIGSEQLTLLEALYEEMNRIGSFHMAERIKAVIDCIKRNDSASARALLRAQASLRVFERLVTAEGVQAQLERWQEILDSQDSEDLDNSEQPDDLNDPAEFENLEKQGDT